MKQRLFLIFSVSIVIFGVMMAGCDFNDKKKEHINAAGHPDEQKDSTRLDPKPLFDPYGTDLDTATADSDSTNSEF